MLGTVLIVFALGTAFRLVLKIVPVPEHRAPRLNRALENKENFLLTSSHDNSEYMSKTTASICLRGCLHGGGWISPRVYTWEKPALLPGTYNVYLNDTRISYTLL